MDLNTRHSTITLCEKFINATNMNEVTQPIFKDIKLSKQL